MKDRAPRGETVVINGTRYFIFNGTKIKVSEHFAPDGKPLSTLLEDVIRYVAAHPPEEPSPH